MPVFYDVGMWLLLGFGWAIYLAAFVACHLRVRRQRQGAGPERRIRRARSSEWGMALETMGILLCFVFRRPGSAGAWLLVTAAAVMVASIALTWWALAHLGRQWRLKAVVTDDHDLITTGPYHWLRHPVYTGLLGMLAATALLITAGWSVVAGVLVFITGTEIRIRAEERILGAHFPETFPAYRSRTLAWLPLLR